ncbi:hypothetical protein [Candidatus Avelusimicrobium sp.]
MIKKVFLFAIAISLCAVASQAQSPSMEAKFLGEAWGRTFTRTTSKRKAAAATATAVKVDSLEKAVQQAHLQAAKKARMQAAQQAPKKVCAHCGQEISHAYQHCDALHGVGLCETAEQIATREAADAAYEKRKAEERAEAMKKYPKCTRCGEPVVSPEQECRATHYDYECTPETPVVAPAKGQSTTSATKKAEQRCTECGRTAEEVKEHGHNHKPPYKFQ